MHEWVHIGRNRRVVAVGERTCRRQPQRKGGPAITRSDLLVINKIDLAPAVGASLEVMARDAARMRGARPFLFTNLKDGTGLAAVADYIVGAVGLAKDASSLETARS